jgi:hypothetical protein
MPEAIDYIRSELAKSGWVIDPRNQAGSPYTAPFGFIGDGFNIMGGYGYPHPPSVTSVGSVYYTAHASKCKGGPYGGVLLGEVKLTNFNGPGKFTDPMIWAERVVREFNKLAGVCYAKA